MDSFTTRVSLASARACRKPCHTQVVLLLCRFRGAGALNAHARTRVMYVSVPDLIVERPAEFAMMDDSRARKCRAGV